LEVEKLTVDETVVDVLTWDQLSW